MSFATKIPHIGIYESTTRSYASFFPFLKQMIKASILTFGLGPTDTSAKAALKWQLPGHPNTTDYVYVSISNK